MAATLDKETLVKHSFWILAGCFVVLVLACLTVLATTVSDTVHKEADALEKAKATVTGIKDPKNQAYVDAYKKRDDKIDSKKGEVWGKAWETQKDMMTWPRDLQTRFQAKYKYFGEPIERQDIYTFDEKYNTQVKEVLDVVQPVTPNGEGGVVQCKGSWWDVLALNKDFAQKPLSKDDIWLSQEELWVKREMLRIIREANDSVARFKEGTPESSATQDKKEVQAAPAAEKDGKPAKAEAAALDKEQKAAKPGPVAAKADSNHKILRNSYWEFDLTLAASDRGKFELRGKITNRDRKSTRLNS